MVNPTSSKSQKKLKIQPKSQYDGGNQPEDMIDDMPMSQQSITSSDAGCVLNLLIFTLRRGAHEHCRVVIWKDYGCRCSADARFVLTLDSAFKVFCHSIPADRRVKCSFEGEEKKGKGKEILPAGGEGI
jgi:hypothetical protein